MGRKKKREGHERVPKNPINSMEKREEHGYQTPEKGKKAKDLHRSRLIGPAEKSG